MNENVGRKLPSKSARIRGENGRIRGILMGERKGKVEGME
jgi:hypothetical protein